MLIRKKLSHDAVFGGGEECGGADWCLLTGDTQFCRFVSGYLCDSLCPGFPTLAGRAEVRQRVERVLSGFDPLRLTVERMFPQDMVVIVYLKIDKKHSGDFLGISPTGRRASNRGNSMAQFRKGKIVEFREHWDIQELLHQLIGRVV